MIVVKIRGGLGNQMFQYAYAKVLEKNHQVKIDVSEDTHITGDYQLDKYNIDLISSTNRENRRYHSLVPKFLRKILSHRSKIIKEKSMLFDVDYLNIEDDNYVIGFFQSEKYFKEIRGVLIEQFTLKRGVSNYTKEIEFKILEAKNSCSIHVRRGDYMSERYIKTHHVCGLKYYENAIKYMQSKIQDIHFFVFSDDIEWAKENFNVERVTYIGGKDTHTILGAGDQKELIPPHEDIYLMSLCSHNIVANSTFSWWGAWLNENKDKIVLAPENWFADEKLQAVSKDVPCVDWVRIGMEV